MGVDHATLAVLILIVVLLGPVLYFIRQVRKGKEYYVRRIPGVDAIDEAVGRAAELGRPISFSTGLTNISPTLYACLGVLYHVGQKSARYKTKLFLPQYDPEVMAISEDILRDSYRSVGRLASFDSRDVMFLSQDQFAYAAGYMGLIQREKVGTAFLFGSFAAEALLLGEAGQQIGAMQVAASAGPEQVAFFIVTCDYTLIGEELFAASAYLTREPVQLGGLLGQDLAKLIIFILLIVGCLVATANSVIPDLDWNNLDYYLYKEFW